MSKKTRAAISGIVAAVLALISGCADNGMFGGGTDVAYGEEVTLEQNSGSSKFTVKVTEPREVDHNASGGMMALAVDIEASTEKGAPSTNRILGPFSLIGPSGETVANHVVDIPSGDYFGTSMPRAGESKSGTLVFLVEEAGDYTVQYRSPLKGEDVSATWSKSR